MRDCHCLERGVGAKLTREQISQGLRHLTFAVQIGEILLWFSITQLPNYPITQFSLSNVLIKLLQVIADRHHELVGLRAIDNAMVIA